MTQVQLELVGHSLGINVYHCLRSKRRSDRKLPQEFYRNYFQGGEGSDSYEELLKLESSGIMVRREHIDNDYFHVTDKGKEIFRIEFAVAISKNINK